MEYDRRKERHETATVTNVASNFIVNKISLVQKLKITIKALVECNFYKNLLRYTPYFLIFKILSI